MILLVAAGFLLLSGLTGWLGRGLWLVLLWALLTLVGAFGVTAAICGADFPFYFNENGRCSASDWPSEVFGSFLVIVGTLSLVGLLVGRLLRSYAR